MTGAEPQPGENLHSPPQGGVEPDRPRTGQLFGMIFALLAVLAIVIVGLWVFFVRLTTDEIHRKELSLVSKEMAEVRARDEGRLTGYDLLDAKAGHYQIPIRRAIEVLLADPSRLAPAPLAAPSSQPGAGRAP